MVFIKCQCKLFIVFKNKIPSRKTLELLKESVKGGELSVTDYFVEADQIYRNLQAFMELECQYQKVAATLFKNRL